MRAFLRTAAIRRALLGLAVVFLFWGIYLALTGGVSTRLFGIRFSSREPSRPLATALALGIFYGTLARRAVRDDYRWVMDGLRTGAMPLAVFVAVGGSVVAVTWGTHAASGADSYGYISQADLWLRGDLIIRQPLMTELQLPDHGLALAPHGYRPGRVSGTIVPTYAPGLPVVMAGASALFGACARYLVLPAFTLVLIWATYVLGRYAAGPPEGLIAAVLVAASPIVLRMSMLPMTDVPAAAAWTAALAMTAGALGSGASDKRRLWRLAAAGAFTAITILIRPNLVLLEAVIAVALVNRSRQPDETFKSALPAMVAYAVMAALGPLAIAAFNAYLYGSPLQSGYGEGFFSWANVGPNLWRYPSWLVYSQTPIVLLGIVPLLGRWLGPAARLNRASGILLYGTILVTLVSYAAFFVFNDWWYLRYMLPAIPAIAVCMVVGGRWTLRHVARRAMPAVSIACVLGLCVVNVRFAIREDVFHLRAQEQRYVWVAHYIRDHTPRNAAIICMQHSGSVRYYGDRLTIRYDVVDDIDRVAFQLRQLGYRPYIVLEEWERQIFRGRPPRSGITRLDWLPIAVLEQPVRVDVFDPDVRPYQGEQAIIPRTELPCDPSPLAGMDGPRGGH